MKVREQARSYTQLHNTCRSELAREGVLKNAATSQSP